MEPLPFGKRLLILGPPVTKKNSQVLTSIPTGKTDRRGRPIYRPIAFPSDAYKAWAKSGLPELQAQWHAPAADQTVHLKAIIFRRQRNHGDLLNYLEAIADLLQEAEILTNDRLVINTDGSRLRVDRTHPHVELWLQPYVDPDDV